MKKRTFLQGLFSAVVLFTAGRLSRFSSPKSFDPSQEYGMSYPFPYTGNTDLELEVEDWAIYAAREALPPGAEFIVVTCPAPRNSDDALGIVSWKYPVPSEYKDLPLRAICSEKVEGGGPRRITQRMIA